MEGQGPGVPEAGARPTGVTLETRGGARGCPALGEERWTGGQASLAQGMTP